MSGSLSWDRTDNAGWTGRPLLLCFEMESSWNFLNHGEAPPLLKTHKWSNCLLYMLFHETGVLMLSFWLEVHSWWTACKIRVVVVGDSIEAYDFENAVVCGVGLPQAITICPDCRLCSWLPVVGDLLHNPKWGGSSLAWGQVWGPAQSSYPPQTLWRASPRPHLGECDGGGRFENCSSACVCFFSLWF